MQKTIKNNPKNNPKTIKNNPKTSMILWIDYFDWIVNLIIDCPTLDFRLSRYGSIGLDCRLDWIGLATLVKTAEIYPR